MDEVENKEVVTEATAPETNPQETAQPTQVDDRQEKNWREMRRKQAELEQKTRLQEELITKLLSQQPQPVSVPQADELDAIPSDDYIPKGTVEKMVARAEKKAEKRAEEAVAKAFEEREKANFHGKLKTKFSDFDDVVTPETLELLETQEPELAREIAELKDPYKIGFQTYKYIKASGLLEKAPNFKRAKEVDQKIEKNAKTVQSPQAFDKRPMAVTFQLTEQMKQDLYKEMMQAASGAGAVPSIS